METREFNNYTVTEHGEVYNTKTKRQIKPYTHHKWNYLIICLRIEKKQKNIPVHRLVAQLFIPNPNNLPEVNHLDGIKHNNAVANLEWCDKSRNIKHAYQTGLMDPKLTPEQVYEIKYVHTQLGQRTLAKMYLVGRQAIQNIRSGKTWTHI